MAPTKLLNFIALSLFAIFTLSFLLSPINAVSVNHARHIARDHSEIAIRKRSDIGRRCKHRPPPPSPHVNAPVQHTVPTSSSPSHTPTQTPQPTHPPTNANTNNPPNPPNPNPPNPGSSGGGNKVGLAWPNGDWIPLNSWKTSHVTACVFDETW
jgi:hypothetical protein